MSAFPYTAAFGVETGDERYRRMSRWVCIYFCLSLIILFLKRAVRVLYFCFRGHGFERRGEKRRCRLSPPLQPSRWNRGMNGMVECHAGFVLFCLSLTVPFLKGAGAGSAFLLSG